MKTRRSVLRDFFIGSLILLVKPARVLAMDSKQAENIFIVSAGVDLRLPPKPKHGDRVYVKVTAESLKATTKIIYEGISIAGQNEDLVLDTIANVRFTFDRHKKSWVI